MIRSMVRPLIGSPLSAAVGSGGGAIVVPDFAGMDSFTRADTANNDLGTPTTDGTVPAFTGSWIRSVSGQSVGAIKGNGFTTLAQGDNCYWSQTLAGPVLNMEQVIQAYGGPDNGNFGDANTLIVGKDRDTVLAPTGGGCVHCQVNHIYAKLQYIPAFPTIIDITDFLIWPWQPTPLNNMVRVKLKLNLQGGYYLEGQQLDSSGVATGSAVSTSGTSTAMLPYIGNVFLAQASWGASEGRNSKWRSIKIGSKPYAP